MNKHLNIGGVVRAPAEPPLDTLVREHPFLHGLSHHQVRLLADCARSVEFGKGELIFRAGDPADRFYLILKGEVALESYVNGRGVIQVQTVGAGEVLGWSWLFPPYYWHFDGRAQEPTEAIFFHGAALRDECEADHDLGYELMKRMAKVMIKRMQAARRESLRTTASCQPSSQR